MKTTEPQIEILALGELKPAPYNPRKISDEAMGRLEKSIESWGLVDPLIVNKQTGYTVVGGHQRLKVLNKRGESKATCVVVDLPVSQEKALNIALNNERMAGEYEFSALADLIQEIDTGEFDVEALTGFSDEELEEIANWTPDSEEGKEETEPIPEPPEKAISQLGDLWELGEHRLLCGNSTVPEDIDRLMEGERAELMFTDPPYGVNYEGGHFHSGDVNIKRKREDLTGDASAEIYSQFLPLALRYVDGPCYLWFSDSRVFDVYKSVIESGGEIHALIIWHKINAKYAAMNAQYKQRHEPCLYFKPKGSTLRWIGPSDERTLWELKRDPRNELHPTQKPICLAERAIRNHSAKTVIDFFCGSGSTIIASESLNRKCYAIEIEPRYVDVAVRRWQNYTGKKGKNLTRPGVEIP